MNTEVSYLYRDACNYKTFDTVIIAESLDIAEIRPFLVDGLLFIPSEIGLPNLQPKELTEDDHVWHEVETLRPTQDAPTIAMDAAALIAACKTANQAGWNEYGASKRLRLV